MFLISYPPFPTLLPMKITQVGLNPRKSILYSCNFSFRVVQHEKIWLPLRIPRFQHFQNFLNILCSFILCDELCHRRIANICSHRYEKEWQLIFSSFVSGIHEADVISIFCQEFLLPLLLMYPQQCVFKIVFIFCSLTFTCGADTCVTPGVRVWIYRISGELLFTFYL